MEKTKRNYKKFILVVSIVVVLNLFFNFGVRTFYAEPRYNDFCAENYFARPHLYPADPKDKAAMEAYEREQAELGRQQKECSDRYTTVRDLYNRNVFIVLFLAGVLSLGLGFAVRAATEAVSLGFSFGGLLSFLIGTLRYWSGMQDYLRFIVLGLTLAALIWLGMKKIKD